MVICLNCLTEQVESNPRICFCCRMPGQFRKIFRQAKNGDEVVVSAVGQAAKEPKPVCKNCAGELPLLLNVGNCPLCNIPIPPGKDQIHQQVEIAMGSNRGEAKTDDHLPDISRQRYPFKY